MPKLLLIDAIVEGKSINVSKLVFILFTLISIVILYMVSAFNDDNYVQKFLPTIIVRTNLLGFARKISDVAIALSNALCVFVIVLIASNKRQLGLNVFKAIKSLIPASEINLNKFQLRKLKKLCNGLVKWCNQARMATIASCGFIICTPLFLVRQPSSQQFWLLVSAQFLILLDLFLVTSILLPPLVHLGVVCYYFRIRIQKLRTFGFLVKTITNNRKNQNLLQNLLKSHNGLCRDIADYNKFWNWFYFAALLFMVPNSLFVLHCLLFGKLEFHMFLGYLVCFVITGVYVFVIGVLFADIAFKIKKSRNQLLFIINKSINSLRLSTWLKTLNSLERIESRKVGFTCGNLYYVSYATVFKVALKYLRFLLLTHLKSLSST